MTNHQKLIEGMRMEALNRIMNVKELADYLNVHPTTLYRMLQRRELPAFRIGTDYRFRQQDIDRWIANRIEEDR